VLEEIAFNTERETKFTTVQVPRQCPLVLLVKISWKESRTLGNEDDKIFGNVVSASAPKGRILTFTKYGLSAYVRIYLNWEVCVRSMEGKVEFRYHLTFWPRIDEISWKTYETRNGEIIFPINVHRFPKKHLFLGGYPNSYVCPTWNSLLVKISVEQRWNDTDRGKSEVLREKPVPVPVSPPQFPQGLAWGRTQFSMIGE